MTGFVFIFLKYAPNACPLLLLMDGHSSQYCPATICLAAKEKVIIFVLPPNTTHILQPLDKVTFAPLKTYWKEEVYDENWYADTPFQQSSHKLGLGA